MKNIVSTSLIVLLMPAILFSTNDLPTNSCVIEASAVSAELEDATSSIKKMQSDKIYSTIQHHLAEALNSFPINRKMEAIQLLMPLLLDEINNIGPDQTRQLAVNRIMVKLFRELKQRYESVFFQLSKNIPEKLSIVVDHAFEFQRAEFITDIEEVVQSAIINKCSRIKDKSLLKIEAREAAKKIKQLVEKHQAALALFNFSKPVSAGTFFGDILIDFNEKNVFELIMLENFEFLESITELRKNINLQLKFLFNRLNEEDLNIINIYNGYGFSRPGFGYLDYKITVYVGLSKPITPTFKESMLRDGLNVEDEKYVEFTKLKPQDKLQFINDVFIKNDITYFVVGVKNKELLKTKHYIICHIPRSVVQLEGNSVYIPFGIQPRWIEP